MSDHKELPPDIVEAEAELRPLYDAAKRRAPDHLRSQVLAAVKAAESAEQAVDNPTESNGQPSETGSYRRPITKWKAFAIAAALVMSLVGLIRKADPWLELRRVPADEVVAHAGHLAYGDDAARALGGAVSSGDKTRHSFFESLPLGVMVVEPSLAEGGAAAPACEARIVLRLVPDETYPIIFAEGLEDFLPDSIRVNMREVANGNETTALANKTDASTYLFRMARDSSDDCGVEKAFVIQMDLSKVGLAAVPVELVTDFTGMSLLRISTDWAD